MRLPRFRKAARADQLTCRELVRLVTDYLKGALSEHDRRRFDAHLVACDGCTTYLGQVRYTILPEIGDRLKPRYTVVWRASARP
jgi:hypothetical protein